MIYARHGDVSNPEARLLLLVSLVFFGYNVYIRGTCGLSTATDKYATEVNDK